MKLTGLLSVLTAFRNRVLALRNDLGQAYVIAGNTFTYYVSERFSSQLASDFPCIMVVPDRGLFEPGTGELLQDTAWLLVFVLEWQNDTAALQTSLLAWIDRLQKMVEDHPTLENTVAQARVVDWSLDAGALAPLGVALLAVEVVRVGS